MSAASISFTTSGYLQWLRRTLKSQIQLLNRRSLTCQVVSMDPLISFVGHFESGRSSLNSLE